MFQQILLAIDNSEHSRKATAAAEQLARDSGGAVVVFHGREKLVVHGAGEAGMDIESPQEGQIADRVAEEFKQKGIDARAETRSVWQGAIAGGIADVADMIDADVIVMGWRGLSDVRGMLVGSVTHKVLHLVHRPVLVVR